MFTIVALPLSFKTLNRQTRRPLHGFLKRKVCSVLASWCQLLHSLGSPLLYFLFYGAPNVFIGFQAWTAGRPVWHTNSSFSMEPCCYNSCRLGFDIVPLSCRNIKGPLLSYCLDSSTCCSKSWNDFLLMCGLMQPYAITSTGFWTLCWYFPLFVVQC